MYCAFRSYDLAEAEIIAALMCAEDCPADVLDTGMSRISWPYVIAYGGFRVVVANHHRARAGEILDDFQNGQYALPTDDDLCCPRCRSHAVEENPNYRGWAFFLPSILFFLPILWPLKGHMRCRACRWRWKELPAGSYAELSAAAEAVMRSSDD